MMTAQRCLSELLAGLAEVQSPVDRWIGSLAMDSRKVEPGGLFLACSGAARHGLEFLSQVLEQGVVAVACEPDSEWPLSRIDPMVRGSDISLVPVLGLSRKVSRIAGRFFGEPSRSLCVIGFTGTNGKTSCSHFMARALAPSCGIIGTLGNGLPGALRESTHTTPDPVGLQAELAQLHTEGAVAVAMEVSSHALEQGRTAAIHFDTAVFTNLSRDHLDYHGSMEEYAASKALLFHMPGLRCALLNLDDPLGREVLERLPVGVTVMGYGLERPEHLPERLDGWLWASRVATGANGMQVTVQTSWGDGAFVTPLLGRFNVSNLLAVLGVLLERGIGLADALARVGGLETVPGRMEQFGGGDHPLVVVDYAHTPDALEQALLALRKHTEGRLICLFGCGGERDRGKRPLMGEISERLADRVVVTDDNPRREDGERIIADILEGVERPHRIHVQRDRAQAIQEALATAGAGDLVLVCGKGHETVQEIGEFRVRFSDREQVERALKEVGR